MNWKEPWFQQISAGTDNTGLKRFQREGEGLGGGEQSQTGKSPDGFFPLTANEVILFISGRCLTMDSNLIVPFGSAVIFPDRQNFSIFFQGNFGSDDQTFPIPHDP